MKDWGGVIRMHGLMPDGENCAGSFPYPRHFACVTVSRAGGGSLVFLSSRGFLLSHPQAVMGTLAAVNGKPDTARYARPAAPSRRALTSWKSLSPAASSSSSSLALPLAGPAQTGSEREMITSISVRSGSRDL